ncbi:MAG TPA: AprI/Inh family metalloprotease inhibitor [Pseudolabrys sp.]|jgi:hypothetical protein|nr:AprI/Inh family metalloprotease inhibitor [Pseudolabrys sp.]
MRKGIITLSGALLMLSLAGCAGTGGLLPGVEEAPPAPKVDMAGRWLVITPNAPSCGMLFGAGADGGTIKPEGGCPGDFFTSRHWAMENGELVIRDHNSDPLAQLRFAEGHFEGKSAKGLQVTLSRSTPPAN